MSRAMKSRVRKLEAKHGKGRTVIVWGGDHVDVEQEIARREAEGTIQPGDEVLVVQWRGWNPGDPIPTAERAAS